MLTVSLSALTDRVNVVNKENEFVYLRGYSNIDFLEHADHKHTSPMQDYTFGAFPLITLLTRLTHNTVLSGLP